MLINCKIVNGIKKKAFANVKNVKANVKQYSSSTLIGCLHFPAFSKLQYLMQDVNIENMVNSYPNSMSLLVYTKHLVVFLSCGSLSTLTRKRPYGLQRRSPSHKILLVWFLNPFEWGTTTHHPCY